MPLSSKKNMCRKIWGYFDYLVFFVLDISIFFITIISAKSFELEDVFFFLLTTADVILNLNS